jgi:hypothetical protein
LVYGVVYLRSRGRPFKCISDSYKVLAGGKIGFADWIIGSKPQEKPLVRHVYLA